MYLASICLLPPHPKMKVVWGGVSEGVISYALMHFQVSWACGENTKYQNIIRLAKGMRKTKRKKRGGGVEKLRSTTADSLPWKPRGRQWACVLLTVHLCRPPQPPPVITLFNIQLNIIYSSLVPNSFSMHRLWTVGRLHANEDFILNTQLQLEHTLLYYF